ncbi:MAG: hypothetical protein ACSLE4_12785, partial [Methyloceanibacter sp.]|uniref:hypothetical protein n=1 Tax=Methyloceanibacter sp. TaxID=1965321 RepID=UPI003EE27327
ALRVIERTKILNPNSAFVQLAAMRAYGWAGQPNSMRRAAFRAMALNPGNRDLEGLAGTMLVMQDDARGEAMLDHAYPSGGDRLAGDG